MSSKLTMGLVPHALLALVVSGCGSLVPFRAGEFSGAAFDAHGVTSLDTGGVAALWRRELEPLSSLSAATPHTRLPRTAAGRLLSAGPRFGLVHVTGDLALSLEYEHDATSPLTVFGWQFEYQFESSPGSPTGLVELIPSVAGLEQGLSLASVSVFAGIRLDGGTEFVLGPYVSPNGVGLGAAVGHTFRAGDLNLPVNLAITRNNHGDRISLTFGWNLRQ